MKSPNPIARALRESYRAWLLIGLLVFAVNGCNRGRQAANQSNTQAENSQSKGSESGAKPTGVIKQVHVAKDNGKGGPGQETDTFGPTDKIIHCVVELAEPNAGAKIRYSWWVVEADGENNEKIKNEKIEDAEYSTRPDDRIVHGHLAVPDDFPPGKYRVDIYVNGNLEDSVEFNVS